MPDIRQEDHTENMSIRETGRPIKWNTSDGKLTSRTDIWTVKTFTAGQSVKGQEYGIVFMLNEENTRQREGELALRKFLVT